MRIFLSDTHLAPFRAEKFATQKKNFIEMVIQFFAKKFEDPERLEKMLGTMRKIIEKEGIKIGYFNGDFMESKRTERGMSTQEDLEMMIRLEDQILEGLGLEEAYHNMGNHESGYDAPLATDPERGINCAAISNFLTFTGREELYHSFFAEGSKIIFVPYIFSEEKAKDFDLASEKKKFLKKMKNDMEEDVPIFILIHDPDSFDDSELLGLIRQNKEKIKGIFFGHYHSFINLFFMRIFIGIYTSPIFMILRLITDPIFFVLTKGNVRIVRELGKYFRKRRNIPAIIEELGATLTPAPSGTCGIGGGFLVLDTEKGITRKYNL